MAEAAAAAAARETQPVGTVTHRTTATKRRMLPANILPHGLGSRARHTTSMLLLLLTLTLTAAHRRARWPRLRHHALAKQTRVSPRAGPAVGACPPRHLAAAAWVMMRMRAGTAAAALSRPDIAQH